MDKKKLRTLNLCLYGGANEKILIDFSFYLQ